MRHIYEQLPKERPTKGKVTLNETADYTIQVEWSEETIIISLYIHQERPIESIPKHIAHEFHSTVSIISSEYNLTEYESTHLKQLGPVNEDEPVLKTDYFKDSL